MKLRVQGNSLRLRLSRSDMDRFAETGRIEDAVEFGAGTPFVYALEMSEVPELSAAFENGRIRVCVPRAQATQWIAAGAPGLDGEQRGNASPLAITIEKDFQCLHSDAAHDPDAFPNPASKARASSQIREHELFTIFRPRAHGVRLRIARKADGRRIEA